MKTIEELLKILDENGSTGLDLSPGDPIDKQAAEEIRRLQKEILELKINKSNNNYISKTIPLDAIGTNKCKISIKP